MDINNFVIRFILAIELVILNPLLSYAIIFS
jgi:hypothetical protein